MHFFLKPIRWLYCIYAMMVFVICMLLVFPIVAVASLWGKMKGGNFIYRLCRLWADTWMLLVGIRQININEGSVNRDRQYVFIANHISYLDIPVILKSIRHNKLRVLGKYEMKRVPIFGFIYQSAVVMVDRSSAGRRSLSVRQLKSVLNRGVSIFIYPEGTFNLTHQPLKEFYDGAFRIAIETQTPIKPILFLDTHDRLHYDSIFSLTPGKSRAVFLDEIPVDGLAIRDVQDLKNRVFDTMSEKLKEYEASWLKAPVQKDKNIQLRN